MDESEKKLTKTETGTENEKLEKDVKAADEKQAVESEKLEEIKEPAKDAKEPTAKRSRRSAKAEKAEKAEDKQEEKPADRDPIEKTAIWKLAKISAELSVPKSQMAQSASGRTYAYRSAEDILQAVRPLAAKYHAAVVLTDDIQLVGATPFAKATAKLISAEDGSEYSTYSYTSMSGTYADMSPAQATGTCFSYARKYALCALFAIGAGEDADSIHAVKGDAQAGQAPQPAQAVKHAQPAQTPMQAAKPSPRKDFTLAPTPASQRTSESKPTPAMTREEMIAKARKALADANVAEDQYMKVFGKSKTALEQLSDSALVNLVHACDDTKRGGVMGLYERGMQYWTTYPQEYDKT